MKNLGNVLEVRAPYKNANFAIPGESQKTTKSQGGGWETFNQGLCLEALGK